MTMEKAKTFVNYTKHDEIKAVAQAMLDKHWYTTDDGITGCEYCRGINLEFDPNKIVHNDNCITHVAKKIVKSSPDE